MLVENINNTRIAHVFEMDYVKPGSDTSTRYSVGYGAMRMSGGVISGYVEVKGKILDGEVVPFKSGKEPSLYFTWNRERFALPRVSVRDGGSRRDALSPYEKAQMFAVAALANLMTRIQSDKRAEGYATSGLTDDVRRLMMAGSLRNPHTRLNPKTGEKVYVPASIINPENLSKEDFAVAMDFVMVTKSCRDLIDKKQVTHLVSEFTGKEGAERALRHHANGYAQAILEKPLVEARELAANGVKDQLFIYRVMTRFATKCKNKEELLAEGLTEVCVHPQYSMKPDDVRGFYTVCTGKEIPPIEGEKDYDPTKLADAMARAYMHKGTHAQVLFNALLRTVPRLEVPQKDVPGKPVQQVMF